MPDYTSADLAQLVNKNRSYRRFDATAVVKPETLRELVSLARHTASAGNKQPLKYVLTTDPVTNAAVFETLKWAGALSDWDGPSLEERPTAYITIVLDTQIATQAAIDVGIVAQTIMLGATAQGLGGCMFLSFSAAKLASALGLQEPMRPALVLALGKPAEHVVIDEVAECGQTAYWRDENQVHHVPKRSEAELIL